MGKNCQKAAKMVDNGHTSQRVAKNSPKEEKWLKTGKNSKK